MASVDVHLIRVTTDARRHQLWVAAANTPEQAVDSILKAIPEGWTAAILSNQLRPEEEAALKLELGEIREITASHRPPNLVPDPATE